MPATVRFSNGSGDPDTSDYRPDVRGLAVTFHLADGSRTDISALTVPRFPFRDVGSFVECVRLSRLGLAARLKLLLSLTRRPRAFAALRANRAALGSPSSFAARSLWSAVTLMLRSCDG